MGATDLVFSLTVQRKDASGNLVVMGQRPTAAVLATRGRLIGAALAAGLAVCAPMSAAAQTTPNTTAAQLLFDRAKELFRAKDYAAACPKFVESHQLDPRGGAILHAANCHEAEGRLATAWAEYDEALRLSIRDKRPDREAIARERLAALTPNLGSLTLRIPPETRKLSGLVLEIDGFGLAEPAWSSPIPLDRGAHVVVARADGRRPSTAKITITDGNATALELPALGAPEAAPGAPREAPTADTPTSTGGTQRILGLVLGGAGIVGLGLGAGFGLHALGIGDQSSKCTLGPSRNGCPADAVRAQDEARASGLVSTVAFAAGIGLATTGAVLYVIAPRTERTARSSRSRIGLAPTMSTSASGLLVWGRF
jgi:hypothetical protein